MRYDELSPLSRADERFLVQTAYPKIDRMSQRDADGPSISRYDGKASGSTIAIRSAVTFPSVAPHGPALNAKARAFIDFLEREMQSQLNALA